MRIPIRLNESAVPRWLAARLLVEHDIRKLLAGEQISPRQFSQCVSSLRFRGTWKTTSSGRQHDVQRRALHHLQSFGRTVRILDVGASDGSTSLDFIAAAGRLLARYYVTDPLQEVLVDLRRAGTVVRFFDQSGHFLVAAGPVFIVYAWRHGLVLLSRGPRRMISLVQPTLRKVATEDLRIRIAPWDMLASWPHSHVDFVYAANVFNPAYFTPEERQRGVLNCFNALGERGIFCLAENRSYEQASFFRKAAGRFVLIDTLGPGSDIQDEVMRFRV